MNGYTFQKSLLICLMATAALSSSLSFAQQDPRITELRSKHANMQRIIQQGTYSALLEQIDAILTHQSAANPTSAYDVDRDQRFTAVDLAFILRQQGDYRIVTGLAFLEYRFQRVRNQQEENELLVAVYSENVTTAPDTNGRMPVSTLNGYLFSDNKEHFFDGAALANGYGAVSWENVPIDWSRVPTKIAYLTADGKAAPLSRILELVEGRRAALQQRLADNTANSRYSDEIRRQAVLEENQLRQLRDALLQHWVLRWIGTPLREYLAEWTDCLDEMRFVAGKLPPHYYFLPLLPQAPTPTSLLRGFVKNTASNAEQLTQWLARVEPSLSTDDRQKLQDKINKLKTLSAKWAPLLDELGDTRELSVHDMHKLVQINSFELTAPPADEERGTFLESYATLDITPLRESLKFLPHSPRLQNHASWIDNPNHWMNVFNAISAICALLGQTNAADVALYNTNLCVRFPELPAPAKNRNNRISNGSGAPLEVYDPLVDDFLSNHYRYDRTQYLADAEQLREKYLEEAREKLGDIQSLLGSMQMHGFSEVEITRQAEQMFDSSWSKIKSRAAMDEEHNRLIAERDRQQLAMQEATKKTDQQTLLTAQAAYAKATLMLRIFEAAVRTPFQNALGNYNNEPVSGAPAPQALLDEVNALAEAKPDAEKDPAAFAEWQRRFSQLWGMVRSHQSSTRLGEYERNINLTDETRQFYRLQNFINQFGLYQSMDLTADGRLGTNDDYSGFELLHDLFFL